MVREEEGGEVGIANNAGGLIGRGGPLLRHVDHLAKQVRLIESAEREGQLTTDDEIAHALASLYQTKQAADENLGYLKKTIEECGRDVESYLDTKHHAVELYTRIANAWKNSP